jgi:glycosyltransferase involved in cell wall biosynthesis
MSSFSAPELPDLKQRAQPKLREANSRPSAAQQDPVRDPITVIIVAPTLDTGAADAGAAGLVRILTDAGHHPIVVSRAGRLVADVVACGGEFIPLDVASNNPIVILRNTVMLTKLARQRKCHAIHAHGRAAAWSAWLAARITGVPFVTTWYKGFREQNVFKRLYNGIMARGDHIVAVSEQIAQLINDRYGTPWARISVVPSSIDLERFNPAKVSRERVETVRRSWGVKPETKVILVVGRIHRRKGHDVVIRAVRRLRDMGFKDFLCVFVGEDGRRTRYTGELWDLVLATDAVDVIRMAAPVNDMPAAYAAASVVISAAVQPEGVQRALLEAQAMARPVIVSDLGAGTDVVLTPPAVPEGRVTGLRFPSGDESALAGAVLRLYSMPEPTRRAIGTRGRAWVLGQFSPATVTEQTLRLYAQIAGREQSPAPVPQTAQN